MNSLPAPTIWLLDARSEITSGVAREISCELEKSATNVAAHELVGRSRLVFHIETDATEMIQLIRRTSRKGCLVAEPCVLVTDRIGTEPSKGSVVELARRKYKQMRIILHSESADQQYVADLIRRKAIDRAVRKGSPHEAANVVLNELHEYWSSSGLGRIRRFLEAATFDLNEKLIETIDGQSFSAIDCYSEIIKGGRLGGSMLKAWSEMADSAETI